MRAYSVRQRPSSSKAFTHCIVALTLLCHQVDPLIINFLIELGLFQVMVKVQREAP